MRVVLLGTAAGGGFPQWNCACPLCTAGLPPRGQDCVAVGADGRGWYLLNASPDLRAQIVATPELRAGPGPRETPLRGVLLTDAELDHTTGLLVLRDAGELPVWCPAAVRHALEEHFPVRRVVDGYGGFRWHALPEVTPSEAIRPEAARPGTGLFEAGPPWTAPPEAAPPEAARPEAAGSEGGLPGAALPGFALDGLRVTALPVGDKRPKYARSSTQDGPWVVAYRVEDPATGGVLVYAPCLRSWPPGFDELTRDASLVLLDGTFHTPDEMAGATADRVDGAAQHAMGHLPIAGPGGSLERIGRTGAWSRTRTRWAYTHLNNTNPVLDPTSAEHASVRAAGVELPGDGTRYTL